MEKKYGVIGLSNLIVVTSKAVDGVKKIFSNGKVGFEDIGTIMSLSVLLEPGIESFKLAQKEIRELDNEDRKELHANISKALVLEDKQVEKAIEDTIKAVLSISAIFT